MLQGRQSIVMLLAGALLVGCPGDSDPGEKSTADGTAETTGGEGDVPDPGTDVPLVEDDGPATDTPDPGTDDDAGGPPSFFETPCSSNAQCVDDETGEEGVCVQINEAGDKICVPTCIENCPPGYGCVAIQNQSGSDAKFACLPEKTTACLSCEADTDCIYKGARCVQVGTVNGEADMRCALSCADTNGTCADDYDCELLPPAEGEEAEPLCVPSTGSCICFGVDESGDAVDGSTRECKLSNEIGTCTGFETCAGSEGWMGCSATEPAEEICDGKDNDCNELVDDDLPEKTCEESNDFGQCSGSETCEGEAGWVCNALEPTAEVCDGEDNNCDGAVDEELLDTDADGTCDELDKDDDGDGIEDDADNCKLTSNPDQLDTDGDGKGDACEEDCDNDGTLDELDNCLCIPNPDQADLDLDNLGDACDPDTDGDGTLNENDCKPFDGAIHPAADELCDNVDNNCNENIDEGFPDSDADKLADCVDIDDDNDGVLDEVDNCPTVENLDQANNDDDELGDACDPDDDEDGVPDETDDCPLVADPGQQNSDNDPFGDACDTDDDNDEILDDEDNCPTQANVDQSDLDGDGDGDACDDDLDGDGSLNDDDCGPKDPSQAPGLAEACDGKDTNCNGTIDEGFPDFDGDKLADCVDPDDDGDGDPDEIDCSPLDPAVSSGAEELCDAIDNNCNSKIDEDCPPTKVDLIFTSAVISGTSGSGDGALQVLMSVGMPGVVGTSAPPAGDGFSVDWGFYYTLP